MGLGLRLQAEDSDGEDDDELNDDDGDCDDGGGDCDDDGVRWTHKRFGDLVLLRRGADELVRVDVDVNDDGKASLAAVAVVRGMVEKKGLENLGLGVAHAASSCAAAAVGAAAAVPAPADAPPLFPRRPPSLPRPILGERVRRCGVLALPPPPPTPAARGTSTAAAAVSAAAELVRLLPGWDRLLPAIDAAGW